MGKPLARCMGGRYCSHQPGECTADPAYQAQIAKDRATPPTDDLERRLRELRAFLNGEAPLYGHWFGDSVPSVEGRPRAFWWRQYLACLTEAADEIARLRAENEALREAVKIALTCTPSARNGEVIYDCGNPWEVLSAALQEGSHDAAS